MKSRRVQGGEGVHELNVGGFLDALLDGGDEVLDVVDGVRPLGDEVVEALVVVPKVVIEHHLVHVVFELWVGDRNVRSNFLTHTTHAFITRQRRVSCCVVYGRTVP